MLPHLGEAHDQKLVNTKAPDVSVDFIAYYFVRSFGLHISFPFLKVLFLCVFVSGAFSFFKILVWFLFVC